MIEELRYRLRGWIWLSRTLLSQVGARIKTGLAELEERGRAEALRRSALNHEQRRRSRQHWASQRSAGAQRTTAVSQRT